MTFLEHLEDLRKRIFYSFIVIVLAVIPAWFFSKQIFGILARPVTKFLPEGEMLAFTSLTEPFMLYIKVAFLAAFFASSPFIFFQFWLFFKLVFHCNQEEILVARPLVKPFLDFYGWFTLQLPQVLLAEWRPNLGSYPTKVGQTVAVVMHQPYYRRIVINYLPDICPVSRLMPEIFTR